MDLTLHRPHDLLWVDAPGALQTVGARPAWATAAWLAVAPVVVRRAPRRADAAVPVGLRGATRSERCAAHVAVRGVVRSVVPEALAQRAAWRPALRASALPCLQALVRLAPAFDAAALAWGVTGGVGFTLASGFDVLRDDSDLDLLVRAASPADAAALRHLGSLLPAAGARVDLQVEAPLGAFALHEWLRTGGPVLLKTAAGPVLVDDPWAA